MKRQRAFQAMKRMSGRWSAPAGRSAFTLLELLVVIGIVTLLAGVSFATLGGLMRSSEADVTRATIDAVIMAIESQGQNHVVLDDGTYRMIGDLDADHLEKSAEDLKEMTRDLEAFLIDGDPLSEAAPASLKDVDLEGYRGFVSMVNFNVEAAVDVDSKQVIDAWGQPLRILWSDDIFAHRGYGVWSIGRDGHPDPFGEDSDDICSWRAPNGGE